MTLGGNTRAWSCPLTLGSLRTDCETRWKQSLWFAWPAPSSENMPVQSEQALVTQSHTRPGAVSQWQGRHTSCYRSTNRKNDIESDHFKVEKLCSLQDGEAGVSSSKCFQGCANLKITRMKQCPAACSANPICAKSENMLKSFLGKSYPR